MRRLEPPRYLYRLPFNGLYMVASGEAEHLGSRSVLPNSIGLLCLITDSGNGNAVGGRVSLQKIAYFC